MIHRPRTGSSLREVPAGLKAQMERVYRGHFVDIRFAQPGRWVDEAILQTCSASNQTRYFHLPIDLVQPSCLVIVKGQVIESVSVGLAVA